MFSTVTFPYKAVANSAAGLYWRFSVLAWVATKMGRKEKKRLGTG